MQLEVKKVAAFLRNLLVRPDDPEQAAKAVQRLNHRCDQTGVAAVTRDLSDRDFEPAHQFFGFQSFLIGHVTLLVHTTTRYTRRATTL